MISDDARKTRLAYAIRHAREKRELTAPELGAMIGRTRGTINDWEARRGRSLAMRRRPSIRCRSLCTFGPGLQGGPVLVTDDVLFIHAPKTAGMSVTRFLADNLPGRKTLTVPEGHGIDHPEVDVAPGHRHETLAGAARWLEQHGRQLADVPLILAVIRNPYDLEVSRYHYLRLGKSFDAGDAQDIALSGDFDRFCREVAYPKGDVGAPIEAWYTIAGQVPPNMRLLRFERLSVELAEAVSPFCAIRHPLPHANATVRDGWEAYLTPDNEPWVFRKYEWLFGFYERAWRAWSERGFWTALGGDMHETFVVPPQTS